ncbi:MAG: hypothetical protein JWN48_3006 [Myxococcaceae bacterium]|nr:hypothetical protein [Myxococcaceae bacterium]
MSKLTKSVSVCALTLVSGVTACSSDSWLINPHHDSHSDSQPEPSGDPGPSAPPVSTPARLQNLVVAERPPPAISGGSLVLSKTGELAVAADSDRDVVYLIGTSTQSVETVSLPKGSEPGRVVIDSKGFAHVALRSAGKVVRIDTVSATVVGESAACQLPRGLAYDDKLDEVLVACASGELVTLDATTQAEHGRVFLELDLRDIVIGKDGKRFVSRYRSAELLQIDAEGKVLGQSKPKTTSSVRFDSFQDGGVSGGKRSGSSDIGPGEGRKVSASATLAWRTIRAPDGTPIMLHQQAQDDEVIISQSGGYGGAGSCQPIVQGGITHYDAKGQGSTPVLLGGAALVVDLAASPDGRWLALAKPGAFLRGERPSLEVISAELRAVEPDAGVSVDAGVVVSDAGVGLRDGGVGKDVPGDGEDLDFDPSATSNGCNVGFWSEGFDAQVTAVAFDNEGNLYAFSREPARLTIYRNENPSSFSGGIPKLSLDVIISLSNVSMSDTGHELFHGDVGTGLACASCHGEALDDGHTWNFRDFGPRRTQNIRGGLLSTLPLHWEGDLSSFQKLVDEVMTRRMGGFTVEPKYGDALANWIDKQPSITMKTTDAAASARGKVLFESSDVQCSTCHSGTTLTNNQTVDVGTGGQFQVPSLRGVALHAPFMHDGCALTLTDRFDPACGGGDHHGKTSQLTADQISDLVAYLQTL